MDESERLAMYTRHAVIAAGSKYQVARVFGSDRHPGASFGRGVPALLVSWNADDADPVDVYPHETSAALVTTIVDFLDELA